MQGEVELLREQLELLKQELLCECQLTDIYRQELKDAEHKLRSVEHELLMVLASQPLGLDEAKEVAKRLVRNQKSAGDLAKLLSAIYNSPVNPGESGQINRFRIRIKSSKRSNKLTSEFVTSRHYSELKSHLSKIEARFSEIEARCREVAAELDKHQFSRANLQERDICSELRS